MLRQNRKKLYDGGGGNAIWVTNPGRSARSRYPE
jgi:hypothetical protein